MYTCSQEDDVMLWLRIQPPKSFHRSYQFSVPPFKYDLMSGDRYNSVGLLSFSEALFWVKEWRML